MVSRKQLSLSPGEQVADQLRYLRERHSLGLSAPTGTIVLDDDNDIEWRTVTEGGETQRTSVRKFAVELSDTSQMAERLEQDLAENATAIEDARLELLAAMENIDATNVVTQGPPPLDPVIGKTIWISPEGYTYRAVECEEN